MFRLYSGNYGFSVIRVGYRVARVDIVRAFS